jgi:enoyl-CoA hydratase
MPPIRYEINALGVGLLTMDRPELRNALNWEAMELFGLAVQQAAADQALRALVITGSQGAFCSGGDLYELDQYPSRLDGARLATVMGEALNQLDRLPVPTVAAIEGPALGGGAEIALACDLRILSESAMFGMMHIKLGIMPAWGGGQRLQRLVGYARALEWLSAGRVLKPSEAEAYRLANRVVPAGAALGAAQDLAAQIASFDSDAVRSIKQSLQEGLQRPLPEALAIERSLFPDLWAAPAHLEASTRFVARRNHQPR